MISKGKIKFYGDQKIVYYASTTFNGIKGTDMIWLLKRYE